MFVNEINKLCNKGTKTPFYCFDTKGFIDNYNDLRNTFKAIYPKYEISYSYKTNYTPYICKTVKKSGGYAEVVSDMEYDLAKKLGYENNHIVYNGPAKGERLEEHISYGGILNIDNYDEAVRVCEFTKKNSNKNYTVGLRINMDVGTDFISRFGLELGSDDIKKTIELLKSQKNVKLIGLHCHISRARGIEAWKRRVEIMMNAADEIIDGIPAYVSLGSGMFASMEDELAEQFGGNVPTYKDYADAVGKPFAEHYKDVPDDKKPILFTEPGTTVVARYLYFVTKVLNFKTVRGRRMATVDGSYLNLGEICTMKNLPIDVIHDGKVDNTVCDKEIDIMGFTCLEQDLMLPNCKKTITEGDIIAFHNCGGYSIVSKPQFIKPNSAAYAIDENGKTQMILREETFEDVFEKFVI